MREKIFLLVQKQVDDGFNALYQEKEEKEFKKLVADLIKKVKQCGSKEYKFEWAFEQLARISALV